MRRSGLKRPHTEDSSTPSKRQRHTTRTRCLVSGRNLPSTHPPLSDRTPPSVAGFTPAGFRRAGPEASANIVQPELRSERTKADMRIACLGGGPAGLYFAIAMKRRQPSHEIVVIERNRPYDTFGWGVVLSDETLAT